MHLNNVMIILFVLKRSVIEFGAELIQTISKIETTLSKVSKVSKFLHSKISNFISLLHNALLKLARKIVIITSKIDVYL